MMIRKVVVLGAGTMGRGIAHVAAVAGLSAVLYDVTDAILQGALKTIRANMAKSVEKGKLESHAMDAAMKRLSVETDLHRAVNEADFVFEAVVEEVDVKKDLFKGLDALCPPDVIFASNTSALSITELAGATTRPDRVIGTHFFNPVHLMPLVEIVRGLETSNETVEATTGLIETMKKEIVVIQDSPGFITSRINVLIGNEAFYMLQEGIASARDIDKALRLGLNHPMGPLELVDLVGLDIRLNVLKDLHSRLGEKFRPCPLLVKYVKAGRLGRKVGRGVYEYENGKIKGESS
jgi:3-hydroxybutyryl-CoA dehydrogenase